MRLRKSHLTFDKIADEWSREVASTPGALGRDDILLELIRAVWRGEFEDDCEPGEPKSRLTYQHKAKWDRDAYLKGDMRLTKPPPLTPCNRRMLLAAMPPIAGVPLPPTSELWPEDGLESFPWKKLKPSIPFDALAALSLDKYEGSYRRIWLELLTISQDDFGRWCDESRHARPAFWFGDEAADTDVSTTVPSRDDENGKRIQAGLEAAAETPVAVPEGADVGSMAAHDSRSHADAAYLRRRLKQWLEDTAKTEDPEKYTKDNFRADAREKLDKNISESMFREVWREAKVPKGFKQKGRRPGRQK